jgi:hypothetical protein
MANNLWIFGTNAEGSYCTTDSHNHVEVASGTSVSIQIEQANERGDGVVNCDENPRTPESKHGTILTTPSNIGIDTQRPAEHTVNPNS